MLIQHLRLSATDLDNQRHFYTQRLGLSLVETTSTSFTVQAGSSRLTFVRDIDREVPHYHFAFNIPENQLSEAKAWLLPRAGLISKDGVDQYVFAPAWNAEGLYFLDADRNVLEFICRHNLPTTSKGTFSPKSLLSISEIGLVVPEVSTTLRNLEQQAGLKVWQEVGADFKAVGSETGLFIVVKEGRPWFPTQLQAITSTLQVDFSLAGQSYRITSGKGTILLKKLIPEIEELVAR